MGIVEELWLLERIKSKTLLNHSTICNTLNLQHFVICHSTYILRLFYSQLSESVIACVSPSNGTVVLMWVNHYYDRLIFQNSQYYMN